MRLLTLLLISAVTATAADEVGIWRFGIGTIDGQPAHVGTVVLTGQTIISADAAPMRLVCSEAPGITVVLAAGSSGQLRVEPDGEGRKLVLDLTKGAVEVDVRDRTPFASVHVRGAAMDIRVTGTLFVVERTRRNADYIALVRGHVSVGLRPEVAKATGKSDKVELTERQGLSADASGLGAPETLSARPQVHMAAALRAAIADQGHGGTDQSTSDWSSSLAAELTGAALEQPNSSIATQGHHPPVDTAAVTTPITHIPFSVIAEDLTTTLSELGRPPQPTSDTVTSTHVSSGAPAGSSLPLPPPPPPGP